MWFNLHVLKKVIHFYQKIVYWRSFLLVTKVIQQWKLNTLFFNKRFKYKFTFARKLKKLLIDYNNYFLIKKKKCEFINSFFNLYKFSIVSNYLILLYNNIDFLFNNKYYNLYTKSNLLNKKYVSLLKQKKIINNKNLHVLNNILLVYKNFYLSEKILIYIDLYIFKYESFFFNFLQLTYFLKYFFLKKCSIKLKLKIWDDCKFTVDNKLVFFKEKGIWLKNLEIFEEKNILFFNQIPLDKVFFIWDVFKSKHTNNVDNNFKYLYYKYKYLNDNFEYLIYKINYLKKKIIIIKNFLLIKKYNMKSFKDKILIKHLSRKIPFFQNRLMLLNLIYKRRKNFKIFKKKNFLKSNKPLNILSSVKKNILYKLFFISFLNFFKKNYLNVFIKNDILKKNFKNIKILSKKIIINFKLLFFMYFKLLIQLDFKNLNNKWRIFLFGFLFYFIEINLIQKELMDLTYAQILQIDFIKKYHLSNIDEFLFNNVWQLLVLNFSFEIDNSFTKRYELLYYTLFLNYKKYWFIINQKKLQKLFNLENLLINRLFNLKFFFTNLMICQKLFEMYQLFSYKFFNLQQYTNLIILLLRILQKLLKNKKIKFFKKFNFDLKKKFFNNILVFSLLNFLKKKINKFKFNLKYIKLLFIFLKPIIIKNNFKKFFFIKILKTKSFLLKKKISLFLRLTFNINNFSFFFLEKQRVLNMLKIYNKLTLSLFYIYLLTQFKYKKFYNLNKKYEKVKFYTIFLLKKKLLKKRLLKKNFKYKQFYKLKTLYQSQLNNINKINVFVNKKLILIYSLNFYIYLKEFLYEYFLFIFKKDFIKDLLININTHFLSTISFFDLQNDFKISKQNFIFKISSNDKKFFFNNRYKYMKSFWYIIKNSLYLEKLNLLINRRLIFITWFDFINNEKNWYKKLEVNDYLFIIRMEHKNFDLDYLTSITVYRSELNFLIQLGLSYFSFLEKTYIIIRRNELNSFQLLNRQLKIIDLTIESLNFYLKKIFLTLIKLKKKKNNNNYFINKNKNININFYSNNYLNNYLYKDNYKKFNLIYSLNCNFNNFLCKNCWCLSSTLNYGNKIMYYQKFLTLNLLNKNILKFNFIFCSFCGKYKISLKNNEAILSFRTYASILKYFIKKKIFENFIFFNNKIQYCIFFKMTNYIFFEDIKYINLNFNGYSLKLFFCYFKNKDKNFLNIKASLYNLKFNNIFIYLIMLLLLNIFFIENYLLIIPKIVKMYNDTIQLQNLGYMYNQKIENFKIYKKKNHIKITKKMKKERKLFHLNKFFDDFKNKNKNIKNV